MGQKNLRTGESVTGGVLAAVADREGLDPTELTPSLHTAIDADALESLVSHPVSGARRAGVRVEFTYCGYDIAVEDGRTVEILDE